MDSSSFYLFHKQKQSELCPTVIILCDYFNLYSRLELHLKAVIIDSDGLNQPSHQGVIELLNFNALL